jgi:hypothetical protein
VFDTGDLVRLGNTFTNFAGVGTNPTTVTLTVRDPSGNDSTPSATSDGSGVYHYDLTLDEAGTWYYKWQGTGTIVAVSEGTIIVQASYFA